MSSDRTLKLCIPNPTETLVNTPRVYLATGQLPTAVRHETHPNMTALEGLKIS